MYGRMEVITSKIEYSISGWMIVEDNNNETKPLDQQTIDRIIRLNRTISNFTCLNNAAYSRSSVSSYLFFIFSSFLLHAEIGM